MLRRERIEHRKCKTSDVKCAVVESVIRTIKANYTDICLTKTRIDT
jgi:hypothetical protein